MAAAAVFNKDVFSARLPDEATIFQPKQRQLNLFLSMYSCLNIHILQYFQKHFLQSMNIDHPYTLDILYCYHHVFNICWIPGHICMHGNNKADKAAKSALKHFIKLYINFLWQIFWDFCNTGKLYPNQNKVNIPYYFNLKRSDATKLLFLEFVSVIPS